jgi:hypothetical protein
LLLDEGLVLAKRDRERQEFAGELAVLKSTRRLNLWEV